MKALDLTQRQAAVMLGLHLQTVIRYQTEELDVPLHVRLHMLALRKLGPKNRLALNRIGYSLALKAKEARHAEEEA